jgi:hypothetical protein
MIHHTIVTTLFSQKEQKPMKKKKPLSQAPGKLPPRKQQWVETRNPSVHDALEILDFPAQNPVSSFYQHSGFSPNMQTTLAITHKKTTCTPMLTQVYKQYNLYIDSPPNYGLLMMKKK